MIFTNDVFSIFFIVIYPYEKHKEDDSPTKTSRHPAVKQGISFFSKFLNTIRENLTNNDISQNVKQDLQKILAWFIIDYFVHKLDLISLARNNFQPQNLDDETRLADETYYVWDPEWSHPSFINIPTDISSQALTTISVNRVYVRITPFTIEATPIKYNSIFTEREGNNILNFTFINQEFLIGTRNLTQQDIRTPSHYVKEEIVETMSTTTQQSISTIHSKFQLQKIKTQYFHKQLYNRQ